MTSTQIQAIKKDIGYAQAALAELGNPFKLGMAGWMLGSQDNEAEFESLFTSDSPFMSLWDEADGFDALSAARVKWPATWLEEDWGLGQPQLGLPRIYSDAKAARSKNCHGLIAKHWRTKMLSANISAMKNLLWVYGTTSAPPTKSFTSQTKNAWVDAMWIKWADTQFGLEVGSQVASILSTMDKAGEPGASGAIPAINTWETDKEDTNSSPSAIETNAKSWALEQRKYSFVTQLENLRNSVIGAGNLERFDYFLKNFQAMKLMAEFGTVRHNFEMQMEEEYFHSALTYRREMARLFEKFMKLKLESINNTSDLGEILSLEILNWHQLIELKYDAVLTTGLGYPIPSDANPSTQYTGSPSLKVFPIQTQIRKGKDLQLNIVAMAIDNDPVLKHRSLGQGGWIDITISKIARSVYRATIPAQQDDFEYYLESGNIVFPVTAPSITQTVVVTQE